MTVLFDATPDYVRFNDGQLSTEYRYLRKISAATSIRLASGPTWQASFTGTGDGAFYAWFHDASPPGGTVSFTVSNFTSITTITGTGTSFTADMVGQFLAADFNDALFKIVGFASATSITAELYTIRTAFGTATNVAFRVGPISASVGNTSGYFAPAHGPFESVEK